MAARGLARRTTTLVAVTVLLACPVAFADTPDPAAADTLFRQGRASAEAGDYPHACIAFAASLRLDAAPGTLLNLADCEERLGRLASAWGHFLRVQNDLPTTDERREIARERALTLAPRVPWMAVTLAADAPPGARAFRDDAEIEDARLGLLLPVDPGAHSVLVVAPGHESRSVAVVAVEREQVRVVVSSGPVLPQVGTPRPKALIASSPGLSATGEVGRSAPNHAAAWLVGATGIVALGVGTYFGGRALAERSMSDESCKAGVCGNATGLAEYGSARNDARASDVALGIGIVALAVSGYLLLAAGHGGHVVETLRVTGRGVGGAW